MCQHHGVKLFLHQPLALFIHNSLYTANMRQKGVSDNAQACLTHSAQLLKSPQSANYYNLMVNPRKKQLPK
jgi:hypothetical protein